MSSFRYTVVSLLLFLHGCILAQSSGFVHDGLQRTYLLHLPPAYDGSAPFPLVIAMHGGFGSALNLQRTSELSEKADAAGFIVVYPEGMPGRLNIRTWNAGGCCGQAVRDSIDDVGFISALIDTLTARFNIDSRRIFATGMSNGGMMAYRLACEIPDRIAAIAPVAATMAANKCNPTRPVPIIHFHSFLDENVPYQGGVGSGVSGFDNPSLDSVFTVWSAANGCTTQKDTLQNDASFVRVAWRDCEGKADLELYLTRDGGHSWPGGKKALNRQADPPSEAINADDLMWAFFQAHPLSLPTSTGHVEAPVYNFRLHQNYPNPFTPLGNFARSTTGSRIALSNGVNPSTVISFQLSVTSEVELAIFDLNGRWVRTLVRGVQNAGAHTVRWDGRDDRGQAVTSGVYLYRLAASGEVQVRRMVIVW